MLQTVRQCSSYVHRVYVQVVLSMGERKTRERAKEGAGLSV